MNITNWSITLMVSLFISIGSNAQNKQNDEAGLGCKLGNSFISDGQDHQILLRNDKPNKLNIIFYPQFRYKIVVCYNNKQAPVEMKLLDNNGTILFSNANKDYIREWEFQFSSIMNGVLELKLTGIKLKEENVRVLIGYQILKTK